MNYQNRIVMRNAKNILIIFMLIAFLCSSAQETSVVNTNDNTNHELTLSNSDGSKILFNANSLVNSYYAGAYTFLYFDTDSVSIELEWSSIKGTIPSNKDILISITGSENYEIIDEFNVSGIIGFTNSAGKVSALTTVDVGDENIDLTNFVLDSPIDIGSFLSISNQAVTKLLDPTNSNKLSNSIENELSENDIGFSLKDTDNDGVADTFKMTSKMAVFVVLVLVIILWSFVLLTKKKQKQISVISGNNFINANKSQFQTSVVQNNTFVNSTSKQHRFKKGARIATLVTVLGSLAEIFGVINIL